MLILFTTFYSMIAALTFVLVRKRFKERFVISTYDTVMLSWLSILWPTLLISLLVIKLTK